MKFTVFFFCLGLAIAALLPDEDSASSLKSQRHQRHLNVFAPLSNCTLHNDDSIHNHKTDAIHFHNHAGDASDYAFSKQDEIGENSIVVKQPSPTSINETLEEGKLNFLRAEFDLLTKRAAIQSKALELEFLNKFRKGSTGNRVNRDHDAVTEPITEAAALESSEDED
jgi:hypothetical protein